MPDRACLIRQWIILSAAGAALLLYLSVQLELAPDLSPLDAHAKDGALVLSALLHSLLGALVAFVQIVISWRIASLLGFARRLPLPAQILVGCPLALFASALLCVLALIIPFGIYGVGLVLALVIWQFARHLGGMDRKAAGLAPIVWLFPLAIVFGAWVGLINHGPTDALTAWPHPDAGFYAGNILSLDADPIAMLNYGFEGYSHSHFNMLVPLIGAVIWRISEFDTFLFINAGGAAIFVIWSAIALIAFVERRTTAGANAGPAGEVLLIVALLTVSLYPTWITDSVPMVYLVALVTSIVFVSTEKSGHTFGQGAFAVLGAIVASLLSKVIAGAFLVPFALAHQLSGLFTASKAVKIAFTVLALVSAAVAVFMLARFVPNLLRLGDVAPISWTWYKLGYSGVVPLALRDLGGLLIAVAALMHRRSLPMLTVAIAAVLGVFYHLAFFAAYAAASLGLALVLFDENGSARAKWVAVLGCLLAVPKAVFGDPSGLWISIPWVLTIVAVAHMALARRPVGLRNIRANGSLATACAVVLAIGMVPVATGKLSLKSGYWFPTETTAGLTPSVLDIWRAVRHRTPQDALIFTDETNERPELRGGWNTYAFHGGRQVYVSQYMQTFAARHDPAILEAALARNSAVLSGETTPRDVPSQLQYSSFYLVVSKQRASPPNWIPVYENQDFSLLKWGG